MKLRRFLTSLLIINLFLQPLLPTWAMRPEMVPGQALAGVIPGRSGAGTLCYARVGDEIQFLIGERNDRKGWCSFGGEADAEDSSLAHAAARETTEETNGIVSPHPRKLKEKPFHDIWTDGEGGPSLFRLYFMKMNYIRPEMLMARQEQATEAHSQEYTAYKWVFITTLIGGAIENLMPEFAMLIEVVGERLMAAFREERPFQSWRNEYSYQGAQDAFQPTY